jgi:hypothetical protein
LNRANFHIFSSSPEDRKECSRFAIIPGVFAFDVRVVLYPTKNIPAPDGAYLVLSKFSSILTDNHGDL